MENGPEFDLMASLRQSQQSLEAARARLTSATVEGFGGGGAVRAVLTGTGDILDIIISPDAVDGARLGDLSQMLVAALQEAQANLKSLHMESMSPLLKSLGEIGR